MIRTIGFDFDGVLVESVEIKTRAYAHLFREEGPEVVQRVIDYHLAHGGVSRFEKFHTIHRNILKRELNDERFRFLCNRFSRIVIDAVVAAPWVAGAREFLLPARPWACSLSQVPWEDEGFAGTKLEYLAYKFGFFFDGHRAEVDCYASLHLLSKNLPQSGDLVLNVLLKNARSKSFRIWAVGSAFEKKDLLKNRGYRWWAGGEGKNRCWYLDIDEQGMAPELEYLKEEIYGRDVDLPIDSITAYNRFSERVGIE